MTLTAAIMLHPQEIWDLIYMYMIKFWHSTNSHFLSYLGVIIKIMPVIVYTNTNTHIHCTLWVKKLDPFSCEHNFGKYCPIFSQPSIYIDGWLYGMRMTSVVCNVPVLSQNDSTYHHSVFTTWKWHPFATWTPSFIILVWGHHPLIGEKPYLPASRTVVIIKTAKRK